MKLSPNKINAFPFFNFWVWLIILTVNWQRQPLDSRLHTNQVVAGDSQSGILLTALDLFFFLFFFFLAYVFFRDFANFILSFFKEPILLVSS